MRFEEILFCHSCPLLSSFRRTINLKKRLIRATRNYHIPYLKYQHWFFWDNHLQALVMQSSDPVDSVARKPTDPVSGTREWALMRMEEVINVV